ncbi:MAG: glycosyltransferase [Lentisphaerae bacterium]|nr:glycosyltransferase [Lentisphaerota bacterium]
MRNWLKRMYRETDLGFELLFPLVRLRDYFARERWRSDKASIDRQFLETFGRPMNWEEPRTLNEKLNWMKVYYRDQRLRDAADKVAVRDLVRERVGEEYLIPLLGVWDRVRDIDWEGLPDEFVMKVNHGSGQNWVVRDKAREDFAKVRRTFREWMAISHYASSREWTYQGLKPRILAEQLLLDDEGAIPMDYKFHCFGGRAECVQVDLDRATAHKRNFYSLDWELLPFVWTEWWGEEEPKWPNGKAVERPGKLAEMIEIAEVLAEGFPLARIDLYYCRGRVFFGEVTFFHGGGFERFEPGEYDLMYGEMVPLPERSC